MRYGKMQHGLWEGWPIRFTDTEAWLFSYRDNKWWSLHPAEAAHNGVLLTRSDAVPGVAGLLSGWNIAVLVTAGFYAVSFWLDNRDPLDSNMTPFLKSEFNSQSLSLQRMKLLDHEVLKNEVSRPA